MKKVVLVMAALAIFVTGTAEAKNQAGCGLSYVIFKDNPSNEVWKDLVGSLVNNWIFGWQFFSIAFGTSGCGASGAVAMNDVGTYLTANADAFVAEAAQGSGQTLNAVAELLSCDANTFATIAKTNAATFASSTNLVADVQTAATGCSTVAVSEL